MFREAALDWISAPKSTDIRKLAKDPLTPDFPVLDTVADILPALRRSLDARSRLLQAVRANIVDIAATISSNWNSLFRFACKNGTVKSILPDART